MMLGVSPATYTFLHALISLIAIGSGSIIMFGFLIGRELNALNFNLSDHDGVDERDRLWFPFEHLLPSHIIGILSLRVLALAILARYAFHLAGRWRWVDVVGPYSALPQRIRSDRVALLEGAGAQSTCSDTERAAVPYRPA